MPDLKRLWFLLEHIHSHESCLEIVQECATLSHGEHDLFFSKLQGVVSSLIDEPDMFYGVGPDRLSPVLENVALAAERGLAAIELGDPEQLKVAIRELTESFPAA